MVDLKEIFFSEIIFTFFRVADAVNAADNSTFIQTITVCFFTLSKKFL
jgi:hypothetical protein